MGVWDEGDEGDEGGEGGEGAKVGGLDSPAPPLEEGCTPREALEWAAWRCLRMVLRHSLRVRVRRPDMA